METNMTLTVGFKGSINMNGLPLFNHDGAPLTVGGIIDNSNTEKAYFGRVVSEDPAYPHQFLMGISGVYKTVGVIQNDYAVREHEPAKADYLLNDFPATVIVFGPFWLGTWTYAGTGTLTTPYKGAVPIFNNTTGAIEFLPIGTAVPSGYTALNAKVLEYDPGTNKVLLFMGINNNGLASGFIFGDVGTAVTACAGSDASIEVFSGSTVYYIPLYNSLST